MKAEELKIRTLSQLSPKTIKTLEAAGVFTIRQLINVSWGQEVPKLGAEGLREVADVLSNYIQ